jgi:hypothetical protein
MGVNRVGLLVSIILVLPLLVLAQSNETGNETTTKEAQGPQEGLQGYAVDSPFEFPELTGFEHPIGSTKVTKGTHLEVGRLTEEGMSWLLEEDTSLGINLKGEKYVIKVANVAKEQMIFTIENTLERQTLAKGEEGKYDLNEDGEYDLTVVYHKQYPPTGRFADVSLFVSKEVIEAASNDLAEVTEKTSEEAVEETEGDVFVIFLVGLLLVVCVVAFCYVILR